MATIEPVYEESNPAALGSGRDPFAKQICDRVSKAHRHKDLYRDLYNDAYDYGFPTRPDFDSTSPGERRTDLIFDDTLVTAIPEFASELQSGLIPAQGEIARLMAGPSVPPEQLNEIQLILDDITDFIHAKFRESNLIEETHEAFQDIAIGTMGMTMDIMGSLGKLQFEAVPLHELLMDLGADGKPDLKCKPHKICYKHIKGRWPDAKISDKMARNIKKNPDVKVAIHEGCYRDWSKKNKEAYVYFVVCKDSMETLIKKEFSGRGSNPMLTARWSANSGEVYGRGLILNVLPTVKSLNLVLQLIFENAQVAIGGIWQYDADGTINPDTIILEPGTFIPRAPGSTIDPLQSPTRFDVAQFVIEDARAAIRKGMLVDTIDQEGKTPASATQIGEEVSKFARRMGASYNRLLNEFVFELFHRAIYLYTQRGIIEMPEIDGELVEVIAVSPLARAQEARDLTDFTRFIEVTNFAYGPQTTQAVLKPEGIDWIARKIGLEPGLLKSQEQLNQEIQAMAQLAQEQPELAGAIDGTIE